MPVFAFPVVQSDPHEFPREEFFELFLENFVPFENFNRFHEFAGILVYAVFFLFELDAPIHQSYLGFIEHFIIIQTFLPFIYTNII